MELDPETVESLAAEYDDVQPLAAVEDEHLEMLPTTLERGTYGWRDLEWVVQWYYRRFLGQYPDADRRAGEEAFGENDFEDVDAAIGDAVAAETTASKLEALTDLTGIDVSVATAFLQFLDPGTYLVMSDREWDALAECDELVRPYPDDPSVTAYEEFLRTCRTVADRCECDLGTVYRALWVVGAKESKSSFETP